MEKTYEVSFRKTMIVDAVNKDRAIEKALMILHQSDDDYVNFFDLKAKEIEE